MKVRVDIPVRLVVEPSALRGAALRELEATLAAELAKTWQLAQREVHGDGFAGAPKVEPTSFAWSGPAGRAFDEPERRAIEKRLRHAIDGVTASALPARATRAWLVHPGRPFRTRFDRFVDFVRLWWNAAWIHELEAKAGEHVTDEVAGTAWVIDVTRDVSLLDVLDDVASARRTTLGDGPYLMLRGRDYERALRALDPAGTAELPHLLTDQPFDLSRGLRAIVLHAGERLIFAAVALPPPSTRAIAEFAGAFDVSVTYSELSTGNLLDASELKKQFGQVDWDEFLRLWEDWVVSVHILPFTVVRAVHSDVLRRFASEHVVAAGDPAPPFARLLRATSKELVPLPEAVANRVLAWAGDVPDPPAAAGSAPDWQAGARGILAVPVLPDLAARILAAKNVEPLRREARELAHIVLDVTDSFWSADRLNALERFFRSWQTERPKPVMEVIFAELDRLGAFTRLFDILFAHYALWGWMRIAVIANVIGTRFDQRQEVQRLVARMNAIIQGVFSQITWDPATKHLVFVHSGLHVAPAGQNNPDPAAGVIGEVKDYFTRKGVVSRPTKRTMERLAEPTRKKVQELMLAMLCKPGESRTRDELIGEAVNAAALKLKLDPEKDFERVKVISSYRVVAVDIKTERGVDAPYVTIEPVQRFADGKWETVGVARQVPLAELDAELTSIHVDHEVAALTVFLLAEALVLSGGYIVFSAPSIWIGAAELIIAISIREIGYIWTTPEADQSVEGYLTEALFACVDVIGFRLGSQLGRGVAARLAGRYITKEALTAVSTRWILYGAKGLAISTVLGTTQVVEKFANDLLHLTHCKRWSSPLDYLLEFGKGFVVGLLCEFVIAPVLSVAARYAIRALANRLGIGATEAAQALAKHVPVNQIEGVLEEGADRLEPALANIYRPEKAGLVREIMDAIRKQIREIVEHARALPEPKGVLPKLRAEWNARAIDELFQAAETASQGQIKLGKAAKDAIARLVRTTPTRDINALLDTLLKAPRLRGVLDRLDGKAAELLLRELAKSPAGATKFVEALGGLDDKVLAILASRGQLPVLVGSPRLVALLGARPGVGMRVLDAFGNEVATAEHFLAELDALPPAARDRGLHFFEGTGPHPPTALLVRALRYPGLVHPALGNLLVRLEQAGIPAAVLDDLLATLERISWQRLETLSVAELKALAGGAELRGLVRDQGERLAFDLLTAVRGDVSAAEHFLAQSRALAPGERAARIVSLKARTLVIIVGEKRIQTLATQGSFQVSAFHGTSSDLLGGLEVTHGKLVPAADLPNYGVQVTTGEGPAFSGRAAKAKTFVSVGLGEPGLGTGAAYADAAQAMGHYNIKLVPLTDLEAEAAQLKTIIENYDRPRARDAEGYPITPLDKSQFEAQLAKVERELSRRSQLPADSPARLGGPGAADNYPVLFEFDPAGLNPDPRFAGAADPARVLGGEASVPGPIDLTTRLRRVYAPAANLADVRTRLTAILGHGNFEVIPLEGLDVLPKSGITGGTREATLLNLQYLEADLKRTLEANAKAAAKKAQRRKPK